MASNAHFQFFTFFLKELLSFPPPRVLLCVDVEDWIPEFEDLLRAFYLLLMNPSPFLSYSFLCVFFFPMDVWES